MMVGRHRIVTFTDISVQKKEKLKDKINLQVSRNFEIQMENSTPRHQNLYLSVIAAVTNYDELSGFKQC